MKRRAFLSAAVGAIGSSALARAQSASGKLIIGILHPQHSVNINMTTSVVAMRSVWQQLGYAEGETVLLRWAEGDSTRLPALAAELIDLKVGVLIAVGPAALRAASQKSRTTPIVAIDLETDPVRAGLVARFGWPGGNVTGLFLDQPSIAGKWLELLREAVRDIKRIAFVWDPTTDPDQLDAAKTAAQAMGIEAQVLEVRTSEGYQEAFRKLGGDPKTGIVQLGSPLLTIPPVRFAEAALKYALPTISFFKPHAKAGALMSYGPNLEMYFPRAVIFADKILKGAKPGELPIEQPDRFELVINLKTANALGITIPPTLLARADEIIE